ncbi:MAG: DUF2911 domain-containing protein [Bacteroidetes bacterium]|nr:DUF2911 domain-containing protein [Bacteroidota bacterium]
MKNYFSLQLLLLVVSGSLFAQGNLIVPDASQKSGVSQRIGVTDISLTYNSPLVKGRTIWGEVVPFGEVWRAGANENTVITFSTPVKISGKVLPAGSYGLHMIPGKNSWVVIFSNNFRSWGSYFYDPAEDALRIEVTPEAAVMQEWLSYRFTDLKASSAQVLLNWEKIGVGFLVEVNLPETVVQSMRDELRGDKGFFGKPYGRPPIFVREIMFMVRML